MKILDMKKIVTKIKNLVDWIHKQIQQEKKKKECIGRDSEKKVHKLKLRVEKRLENRTMSVWAYVTGWKGLRDITIVPEEKETLEEAIY